MIIRSLLTLLLLYPSLAAATPVIFRVSDPLKPGQTALLFGDDVGEQVVARGWRLDDETVPGPPAEAPALDRSQAVPLRVLQASELSAKVLVPEAWQPGCYAVLLENEEGVSHPIFLNRTQAWWWLGGPNDTAVPGEQLRVFGKNLGAGTRAWLARKNHQVEL
jgi:hypothetical protein